MAEHYLWTCDFSMEKQKSILIVGYSQIVHTWVGAGIVVVSCIRAIDVV